MRRPKFGRISLKLRSIYCMRGVRRGKGKRKMKKMGLKIGMSCLRGGRKIY